jgi:hypothetical protein
MIKGVFYEGDDEKMKGKYRGCDIEVYRDKSMADYELIFYSVFDGGYEIKSGFYESEDKLKDFYEGLKANVDEYLDELHLGE